MRMNEAVIASIRAAVEASPDDVPLRVHLCELLLAAGDADEAVGHAAAALQRAPRDAAAQQAMQASMHAMNSQTPPAESPAVGESTNQSSPTQPHRSHAHPQPASDESDAESLGFDWQAAEAELDGPAPMFVDVDPVDSTPVWDVERPTLTLADVGGLDEVKARLNASFLAPLSNPELRELYGKSLKGGLLMYGPPGCGKTFLARAVAGEIGAEFMSIGITDVLDMFIGNSEKNLHGLFEQARANAPVVLFLDELDALGAKRSSTSHSGMRTTINQLLMELDGYGSSNDGVFVLGATNRPWDVDTALRRPGRFDRAVLVTPPDQPARVAILRHHLMNRPVEGVDLRRLADLTDGLTGADLAAVCERAAESALLDSVRTGTARMIAMADLEHAAKSVKPSASEWFTSARNVVTYADPTGTYAELKAYMKTKKLL